MLEQCLNFIKAYDDAYIDYFNYFRLKIMISPKVIGVLFRYFYRHNTFDIANMPYFY